MSDTTLYTARYLLPMVAAPIEDAGLLVRNDRIVAVGRRRDLSRDATAAVTIDFGDSILLPPLVNAHTHLELTDFPLWSATEPPVPPEDFVGWILQLIRIKRARTMEQMLASLRRGLNALLHSGTGAVADILSQPELAAAYTDTPLLGRVDLELIGRGETARGPLHERAGAWLSGDAAPLARHLRRGLSPHAPYTVAPENLGEIADFARQQRSPLAIHLAESSAEVELLRQGQGPLVDRLYALVGWMPPSPVGGPVDYLQAAEALRPSTLLVHGVQLDNAEIRRIAVAGASLVLCPRSNRNLGVGRAPVEALRCQGVNLALGTDSLASNGSLSLYDELEAALPLYAPALSPVELLRIATCGGAAALGLGKEIGALVPGLGAHFQVLQPTHLPAISELAAFLCAGERGEEIKHLFLHGRDVLAGGGES